VVVGLSKEDTEMYSKPQLQRFGSLREITRLGYESRTGDGLWAFSMNSQNLVEYEGGGGGETPSLS
jgi:hypothetical protein